MRERIEEMIQCLKSGAKETQPSAFWDVLNKKNIEQLSIYGYENFKRTIAKNYFTWSLIATWNPQVIFLIKHVNLMVTVKNIFKTLILFKHKYLTLIESFVVSFLTLMVWEYMKQNNGELVTDIIDEPKIGNPPRIYLKRKLISEDLANSIIEFQSIIKSIPDKNRIKTICELGGGYGRNAFVFLSMMPGIKYIMIDIPPALYVSERYLSEVFPEKKIFKFRKFDSYYEIKEDFEKADILFFLSSQIELIPDKIIDLSINISSFHEMRPEQIQYYFRQFERLVSVNGYLYLKEWKDMELPFEGGIHIKMSDYPIKNWTKIFWKTAKVQIQFFDALLKLK